jgi:hypothetical protein
MFDRIQYSLSAFRQFIKQDKIKCCKNSNRLECEEYLNGLNDLLNEK